MLNAGFQVHFSASPLELLQHLPHTPSSCLPTRRGPRAPASSHPGPADSARAPPAPHSASRACSRTPRPPAPRHDRGSGSVRHLKAWPSSRQTAVLRKRGGGGVHSTLLEESLALGLQPVSETPADSRPVGRQAGHAPGQDSGGESSVIGRRRGGRAPRLLPSLPSLPWLAPYLHMLLLLLFALVRVRKPAERGRRPLLLLALKGKVSISIGQIRRGRSSPGAPQGG